MDSHELVEIRHFVLYVSSRREQKEGKAVGCMHLNFVSLIGKFTSPKCYICDSFEFPVAVYVDLKDVTSFQKQRLFPFIWEKGSSHKDHQQMKL